MLSQLAQIYLHMQLYTEDEIKLSALGIPLFVANYPLLL